MHTFRSTTLTPHISEETITLSGKSSRETIIPTTTLTDMSSFKSSATKSASSTPRPSIGIFRRRTIESMECHNIDNNDSLIEERKKMAIKRTNTAHSLLCNSSTATLTGLSSTSLSKTSTRLCSPKKQMVPPHRQTIDANPAEKTTPCKNSTSAHKLGTVPKYLSKTSIHTMRSMFTSKLKQFTSKRSKYYEQQKCVMDDYRALLAMRDKLCAHTGKRTKLDELDVIAYKLDRFYLCLCMGSANYNRFKLALEGVETSMNEWGECCKTNDAEVTNASVCERTNTDESQSSLMNHLLRVFQQMANFRSSDPRKMTVQNDFSEGGDTRRNDQNSESALTDEINAKNQQIETLDQKSKSLSNQLSAEKLRCSRIASEKTENVQELTKQIELSRKSIELQQLQINDLNRECQTIRCSFTDLQNENDQLTAKLTESDDTCSKLMSELKTMTNKFQCAQKHKEKLNDEFSVEDIEKSRQIEELNAFFQEKTESTVKVNNDLLMAKTTEVIQLAEENDKFRIRLDTLTNENEKLRNQLDRLTKVQCQLRVQLDALTKDYDVAKLVISSKTESDGPSNEQHQATIKHRDATIVKLEHKLSSEKSIFKDMLQDMQQQLMRLQKSEFDKNIQITNLKSERTKMITEIAQKKDQIALLESENLFVDDDAHVDGIRTGIVNQAAIVKRLDTEIYTKLQNLLALLKNKTLQLEEQRKLIHILRVKQQQCRTIRVQQCERIAQLNTENVVLLERLRVNEVVASICSAQMQSRGSSVSRCCVVEDESITEDNFDHGTYFREYRREKRRNKIQVKKYYC